MMRAMRSCRAKVISAAEFPDWRRSIRERGLRLAVTNGCFDLLHAGHVSYLEAARAWGDVLLVGVNSDESVRQIKGPDRPWQTEQDRALVVAALESVDAVLIFREISAREFLASAQPDVWVKGGDYDLTTVNQAERRVVETQGGIIRFAPLVEGRSTTRLAARLNAPQPGGPS